MFGDYIKCCKIKIKKNNHMECYYYINDNIVDHDTWFKCYLVDYPIRKEYKVIDKHEFYKESFIAYKV